SMLAGTPSVRCPSVRPPSLTYVKRQPGPKTARYSASSATANGKSAGLGAVDKLSAAMLVEGTVTTVTSSQPDPRDDVTVVTIAATSVPSRECIKSADGL